MHIANSLYVGQNAGAYHEGKEMNCHKDGSTGTEGDQETRRVVVVCVYLHFYHSHLERKEERDAITYITYYFTTDYAQKLLTAQPLCPLQLTPQKNS